MGTAEGEMRTVKMTGDRRVMETIEQENNKSLVLDAHLAERALLASTAGLTLLSRTPPSSFYLAFFLFTTFAQHC